MYMVYSNKQKQNIYICNWAYWDIKSLRYPRPGMAYFRVNIHQEGNRTSPDVDFSRDAVSQTST